MSALDFEPAGANETTLGRRPREMSAAELNDPLTRRGDDNPEWAYICALDDIPVLGARVVEREAGGNIAIFRSGDDAVFALLDRCPHKGGPLSQGIVFGTRVACPLHNWTIALDSGCANEPDEGCTQSFAVKLVDGRIFLEYAVLAETPCAALAAQDA
jgi:nitrite reductase (NADH) small subunit